MKKIILFYVILCFSCSNDISSHLTDKQVLTAELFLPNIVTAKQHSEFSIAISPVDAKTIFFTRRIGDGKQKIYETRFENNTWTEPTIASFSTDRDESPSFSKDGKTLYFGSEREIPNQPNKGNFDMNVWKTTLDEDGNWTIPEVLPSTVNAVQIEREEWPSSNLSHFITIDDVNFYGGTQIRGEKGLDIYKTTLQNDSFSKFEKLPKEINTENKWEYAPILSYDGNYIFFQVYNREDGLGGDDIFVSKRDDNGKWLPSKNLGSLVNTKLNECPISITADGKYFLFTRAILQNPQDQDGIASIFFIETKALNLDKLFKTN